VDVTSIAVLMAMGLPLHPSCHPRQHNTEISIVLLKALSHCAKLLHKRPRAGSSMMRHSARQNPKYLTTGQWMCTKYLRLFQVKTCGEGLPFSCIPPVHPEQQVICKSGTTLGLVYSIVMNIPIAVENTLISDYQQTWT
jgi:hypothetical protein